MVKKLYEGLYFYHDEKDDKIYYITDQTDRLKTKEFKNHKKSSHHWVNKNNFRGFEKNDLDTLLKFRKEYNSWIDEIYNNLLKTDDGKKFRIKLKRYRTLKYAIKDLVFMFGSTTEKEIFKQIETIDSVEYLIHSKCYKAGLMTCDKEKLNKPLNLYGYDFAAEYPNRLNSISIPTKQGCRKVIKTLDFDNLECGIYRVKILYSNTDFTKLFSFSECDHYTSSQLRTLYQHKDLFGLKFDLLEPDEDYTYNCYIYPSGKENYFELKTLFDKWLKSMLLIKSNCSKTNQLIKYLISSVWGVFTETKKIHIEADLIDNYDCEDEYCYKCRTTTGHLLIDYNDIAYFKGLYRIKIFLSSSVRNFMLNYAVKNSIIENIVRIHTDSYMLDKEVIFHKPLNFCKKQKVMIAPKPETKSTGYIKIYNVNNYVHICKKCGCEFKYNDFVKHKC